MRGAVATGRLDALPSRDLAGGMRVAVASTRASRARGLARLEPIPPSVALHIPRCRSVHTFGMRFGLDLVWLDGDGRAIRVDRDVRPRRLRTCLRARSVVECRRGTADAFLAAGLGGAGLI